MLGLLAAAPLAHAQNLEAYRQMSGALEAASNASSHSAITALKELDKAEAAFAQLQPTLRDTQLSSRIRQTLVRARGTLARTPTEVQAQTAFAQALMRQALYEQTLSDLLQSGETADSAARLTQLAQNFSLSASETQSLLAAARAGQPAAVAARLQQAAARQVVRELQPWSQKKGAALGQEEAYLRVTRASGWHLLLASLPNAAPQTSYNAALQQLATGQLGEAAPSLHQLYVQALGNAGQLGQTLSALKSADSATAKPTDTPTPPVVAKATAQQPNAPQFQTPQTVGQASAATTTATQHTASVDVAPPTTAPAPTKHLEALAPTYAALARALAASTYDQTTAHTELKVAASSTQAWPAEWQQREGQRLAEQFTRLSQQTGLLPGDITLQIANLQSAERRLSGEAEVPQPYNLSQQVAQFWTGRNQALAFFLLALLTPLPFYFKAKALGRHERAWKLVSGGISLLLLPLIVEGISAIAAWLGQLTGQTALSNVASLSIRYDLAGQFLWWLFSLLGVLLLTEGFRRLGVMSHRTSSARQKWNSLRHSDPNATAIEPEATPEASTTSLGKTMLGKGKTMFGKKTAAGESHKATAKTNKP